MPEDKFEDDVIEKVRTALLRAYANNHQALALSLSPLGAKAAEGWIRDAVSLTATAAVESLDALSQDDPTRQELWRNAIINRILRGILWTIHNNYAPGFNPPDHSTHRPRDRSLVR